MGKRPDQYQIDVGEGGATDYKNVPQTGRGHSNKDDTVELDRQQVEQNRKKREGQPVKPDVPAPTVHTKRGTKAEPAEAQGDGDPEDRA